MLALGLFALGIFIGTIVTIAVANISDWTKLQKILSAIVTATFAGAVMAFVRLASGAEIQGAAAYYPIGLFYGLLWYYARVAVEHVQSDNRGVQALGWLHTLGLAFSILLACLLFLSTQFRNMLPH